MEADRMKHKLKLKICIDNTELNSDEEIPQISPKSEGELSSDDEDDNIEFNVRLDKSLATETIEKILIEKPKVKSGSESDARSVSESDDSESGQENEKNGYERRLKAKNPNDRVDDPDVEEDDVEFNVRLSNYVKKDAEKRTVDTVDVYPENRPLEKLPPKVYRNKVEEFITGLGQSNEEIKVKRSHRAKRFGIKSKNDDFVDIKYLYNSFEMKEGDIEDEKLGYRLNTIHMRGIENLSTDEVFAYFNELPASTIEWINDTSCNIVWVDQQNCARAMYKLSRDRNEIDNLIKFIKEKADGDVGSNASESGDDQKEKKDTEKMLDDYDDLDLTEDKDEPTVMDVDEISEPVTDVGPVKSDNSTEQQMEIGEPDKPPSPIATNAKVPDAISTETAPIVAATTETAATDEGAPGNISTNTETLSAQTTDTKKPDDMATESTAIKIIATDTTKPDDMATVTKTIAPEDMATENIATTENTITNNTTIDNKPPDTIESDTNSDSMDVDKPHHDPVHDLHIFRMMKLNKISWPFGVWRLGVPCPRTRALFMRFAMKDDVKLQGAEKRSQYYIKHGNPNYEGLRGLISKSKKNRILSQKIQAFRDGVDPNEVVDPNKGRSMPDYTDNLFDDAPPEPDTRLIYEEPLESKNDNKTITKDDIKNRIESRTESHLELQSSHDTQKRRLPEDYESSSDSDGREELERLLGRSRTKRFMRMHADDVDDKRVSSNQLQKNQLKVTTNARASVMDRLGGSRNLPNSLQSRLGNRK